MAIAYSSVGTASAGTTSTTPSYPAVITAGDLLVLYVINKYPTAGPATPSNWNLIGQATGGAGVSGSDSGNVYCTAFYRIADGTETGTVTVTVAGGNSIYSRIARYTKAAAEAWSVSTPSYGSCALATTSWSVTGNVTLDVAALDVVVAVSGVNADTYTYTAEVVTIPGVVMGASAERIDQGTTLGDDCHFVLSDHAVTSGTPSGVPVYTMTASGSSVGVSPAGATLMFRLRVGIPSPSPSTRVGIGIGL